MKKNKIFACILPFLSVCLASCSGSGVHHDAKEYFVDVDYKTDFKILQLTDLHLTMEDDLNYHLKFVDLTIKDANPDFIICTGDIFTFATTHVMDTLFNFFESHKIPWGVTFGNHDEQTYFSIKTLTGNLNSKYEYCKFIDIQDDDVYGNANYIVNINKDGKAKYQLVVLDSNRYEYTNGYGYDNFHQDQVDWYERVVKYSTEKNGYVVPSLAFFHIPFEEYEIAYNLYKQGSSLVTHHYGENREGIACSRKESQMFEKMVELGSTKACFVGHDHINNSDITYQGIELVFGIKATDRVYADKDMMGGLTITIHDDNSYTIDRIYHTYEEVK